MFTNNNINIWKKYLPRMLNKRIEGPIIRTGEAAKKIDTYVIYLSDGEQYEYLLDRIDNNHVIALKWNEEERRFSDECFLSYKEIVTLTPEIIHYYGVDEIKYHSINELKFSEVTNYGRFRIKLNRLVRNRERNKFNKQELVVNDRIKILKTIIKIHVSSGHNYNGLSDSEILDQLHSILWIRHPKADIYKKELLLTLESLVDDGCLIKQNYKYIVTGRAVSELSKYEIEELRYDQQLATQQRMSNMTFAIVVLTLITAVGGLVQAGILKIPTLFSVKF
ncbi:hypothetical protein [Raoultella terrigena]|uniref:hypothetical protein n=1 Tax=Raoultella terrigena TaxID=577 RepID=UPI0005F791DF|nr:hypothetical protein [Raoultella terrigena]